MFYFNLLSSLHFSLGSFYLPILKFTDSLFGISHLLMSLLKTCLISVTVYLILAYFMNYFLEFSPLCLHKAPVLNAGYFSIKSLSILIVIILNYLIIPTSVSFLFLLKNISLFIWLHGVLVVACGI